MNKGITEIVDKDMIIIVQEVRIDTEESVQILETDKGMSVRDQDKDTEKEKE